MQKSHPYNRQSILDYSKNLFDKTENGFKFTKNNSLTILSKSYGVQLNYLLDNLNNYPVETISIDLKGRQNRNTGLFVDSDFDIQQTNGYFELEYLSLLFTYFSTIALDMLGCNPTYPFLFLEIFKDKNYLQEWINKQNYKDFWYTSNKIMFLLYFLTYEQERLNIDNIDVIYFILDIMDTKQDPNTGFWGTQNGASLENGMFGASHIYLFYNFHNREIKYKNEIIDNTIKLQNQYGLFGTKYGGACEDYDAIEILSIISKHTKYKFDLVKKIISKTYTEIARKQRPDGGFSNNIDTRDILRKIKHRIERRKYYYIIAGWKKMQCDAFKSDIWSTYFRTLTLAKIETMLELSGNNEYKFYSLPGWGYY